MDKPTVTNRIDASIRFFLYILIFWLPYSPAVIETCVILSLLLWIVKRVILCNLAEFKGLPIKNKFVKILKAFEPKSTPLNIPVSFFIFVCLLSVAGSAFREIALHGFLTKTLEWFIIYFLVIEVFTQRKHVYIALGVFLFSSLATCLDSIVQFHITYTDIFRGRVLSPGDRAVGPFERPNTLGGYLTFVIPLVLSGLFFSGSRTGRRLGAVVFSVVAVWAGIVSFSRGALSGIGAGILFILFIIKKRIMLGLTLVLFALFLCLSIFASSALKQHFRINPNDISSSVKWRMNLWEDSLRMVKDRPFFGHGLNTYMSVSQEYRRKHQGFAYYNPTYAHNCYIQMAGEIGLFGLAGFLWIFGRFFKEAIKIIQRKYEPEMENPRIMCIGLACGVFAFLAHSFFDTNFYSLQLSALFWFMAGLTVAAFNLLNQSDFCDKRVL